MRTTLSALLVVVSLPLSAHAVTPTIVQYKAISDSHADQTDTVQFDSAVTAGNTLVCAAMLHTSEDEGTYSFSDDANGNWTGTGTGVFNHYIGAEIPSHLAFGYKTVSAGGTAITVTIDRGGIGTEAWRAVIYELANADTLDVSPVYRTSVTDSTTHNLLDAVTVADESIVIGMAGLNGTSGGSMTQPTDWAVQSTSNTNGSIFCSKTYDTSASITPQASSATARIWHSYTFSMKSAGGGGVAVDPLSKTITGSPTAINPIPSGF